jgi:hypothetical protein
MTEEESARPKEETALQTGDLRLLTRGYRVEDFSHVLANAYEPGRDYLGRQIGPQAGRAPSVPIFGSHWRHQR